MKNAQLGLPFGIMMFLFVFVLAVVLTQPLKQFIDIQRDSDHLDCNNSSITLGQISTCLIVDLTLPMFIGTVIFSGIGVIFAFAKLGG